MSMNKCNGNCCRNFTFRFNMEELKSIVDSYELDFGNRTYTRWDGKIIPHNFDKEEVTKIYNMLIPLGISDIDPKTGMSFIDRSLSLGETQLIKDWNKEEWKVKHYEKQGFIIQEDKLFYNTYTCKHFNTETNLCNDYENRPNMCILYQCELHLKGFYEGCFTDKQIEEYNNSLQELSKG